MKNIKSIIKKSLLSILFLGTLSACEDGGYDEYGEEAVATLPMNGEWMIEISDEAGNVYGSHLVHKTYELNGQLWISDRVGSDDVFTGWYLETPLNYDLTSLTFSATEQLNTADESVVTITNGKIMKNVVTAPSGTITDSIYFEGVFDYDPDTTLKFAGYRRTGFLEDE